MAKKISGITVAIDADVTGVASGLKDINDNIYQTQRELRQLDSALKLDPDNVELLAEKQEALKEQISQTTEKLEILKATQEEVNRKFKAGEISREEWTAFQKEIAKTEKSLESLLNPADKAEKAIEDVGDSAEESEEGFTIMKGALADLTSEIIQNAVSAFGDLVSAIFELDEATEEYRTMQAKLEASAKRSGYSAEYAKDKFEEFYELVGDDQMATNAVTNLMGLQVETDTLNKLADGAKGVWASYGDSIPIESLTEAVNETIQVGKVTGTFADTLNWVKLSNDELAKSFGEGTEAQKAFNEAIKEGETQEDAFSKALEATSDQQERAEIVARFLNDTYGTSIDTYKELNDSAMQANASELALKDTQAQLGEAIAPVNRAFEEMKTNALGMLIPIVETASQKFLELYNYLKEHPVLLELLTALALGLATALGILATALGIQALINGVTKAFAFLNTTLLANPITLVITAISAMVVAILYLWNNCEEFRNGVISIYKAIESTIVNGFNWICEFLSGLGSTLYGIGVSILGSLKSGVEFIWKTLSTFFTVTIPNAITSIADVDLFDVGSDIINSLWDGAKSIWSSVSGWFSEKMSWVSDKLSWILGKKDEADGIKINGKHATGLAYVPFDGYVAMLHQGERVLTAKENQEYMNGGSGRGGVNVTQNIYVPTDNPRELQRQAQRNLVKLGLGV